MTAVSAPARQAQPQDLALGRPGAGDRRCGGAGLDRRTFGRGRQGRRCAFLAWNKGQLGVRTRCFRPRYQVLKEGAGPKAQDGDGVSVWTCRHAARRHHIQPAGDIRLPVGGRDSGFGRSAQDDEQGSGGCVSGSRPASPAKRRARSIRSHGKLHRGSTSRSSRSSRAAELRQMMLQQQMMQHGRW